jgi:hypothetical protein
MCPHTTIYISSYSCICVLIQWDDTLEVQLVYNFNIVAVGVTAFHREAASALLPYHTRLQHQSPWQAGSIYIYIYICMYVCMYIADAWFRISWMTNSFQVSYFWGVRPLMFRKQARHYQAQSLAAWGLMHSLLLPASTVLSTAPTTSTV